eukprot:90201-Karenia_brevis.AAC.1
MAIRYSGSRLQATAFVKRVSLLAIVAAYKDKENVDIPMEALWRKRCSMQSYKNFAILQNGGLRALWSFLPLQSSTNWKPLSTIMMAMPARYPANRLPARCQ